MGPLGAGRRAYLKDHSFMPCDDLDGWDEGGGWNRDPRGRGYVYTSS